MASFAIFKHTCLYSNDQNSVIFCPILEKFGIKMKKTSTSFLLYGFYLPYKCETCQQILDFQTCPGTFLAECISKYKNTIGASSISTNSLYNRKCNVQKRQDHYFVLLFQHGILYTVLCHIFTYMYIGDLLDETEQVIRNKFVPDFTQTIA